MISVTKIASIFPLVLGDFSHGDRVPYVLGGFSNFHYVPSVLGDFGHGDRVQSFVCLK